MTTKRQEPPFSEDELRSVAKVLPDIATHDGLSALFREAGLDAAPNVAGLSKWQRISNALVARQSETGTGNFVMKFIQVALQPRRFVDQPGVFEDLRERVNRILAFRGWQLTAAGKFDKVGTAQTVSDARQRANRLRDELERRGVHPDVLRFCREELLQENYFHAVLEATKSVADKLREKTGLPGDGADLVQSACGLPKDGSAPLLAFNALRTDSERSEHKGIGNLLTGFFGTFRNPTAHAPKISWPVNEQDALDLLTMASFLHRRMDTACVLAPKP